MKGVAAIPKIVKDLSLDGLVRIDAALEGDWNSTVTTVWIRGAGRCGFEHVAGPHPGFKPSLELYFDGAWVGVHCYRTINGQNVFDEPLARDILDWVEYGLRKKDGSK